jgi:hypothetical protein
MNMYSKHHEVNSAPDLESTSLFNRPESDEAFLAWTVLRCLAALPKTVTADSESLGRFLPDAVRAKLVSPSKQTNVKKLIAELLTQLNDKMIALRDKLDQISENGGDVFDFIKNEYGVHFVGTLITSQLFNERCDNNAATLQETQRVLQQDTELRAAVVKQISAIGAEAGKQVTRNRNDFVTALELTKRWCDLTSPEETAWIPKVLNGTLSQHVLSYNQQNTSFMLNFSRASLIHPGLAALRENFNLKDQWGIYNFADHRPTYLPYILDRISGGYIPKVTRNDCPEIKNFSCLELIELEKILSEGINQESAKKFVDKLILPRLSSLHLHSLHTAEISLRLGFLLKHSSQEVSASIPAMFDSEQLQRIKAKVALIALVQTTSYQDKAKENLKIEHHSLETLIPAALVSGFIEADGEWISNEEELLEKLVNKTNQIKVKVDGVNSAPETNITELFNELGPVVFGELFTSGLPHLHKASIAFIGSSEEMIAPVVNEIARILKNPADNFDFKRALEQARIYSRSSEAKPAIAQAIVSELRGILEDSENYPTSLFVLASELHNGVASLRQNLQLQNTGKITQFFQKRSNRRDLSSFLQHIQNGYTPTVRDTKDTQELCSLFSISPIELEKLYINKFDLMAQAAFARNGNERLYQTIFSELSEVSDEWRRANEDGDFRKVAELIGYEQAFTFISKATGGEILFGTSVLSKTVKFAEGWLRDVSEEGDSSVQPEQIRKILNEVTADSSKYGRGNSAQHLNAIVSADFSLTNTSNWAEQFTSRKDIAEGILRFKNTPPLSSWEDLKYWAAFSSSVKEVKERSDYKDQKWHRIEPNRFLIPGGPQFSYDVVLIGNWARCLNSDYYFDGNISRPNKQFARGLPQLVGKLTTDSTTPLADHLAPIVIRFLQDNPRHAPDVAEKLRLEDHRLSSVHLQEYGRQLIRCSLAVPSQAGQLYHVIIKIQAELDKRASNSENRSSDSRPTISQQNIVMMNGLLAARKGTIVTQSGMMQMQVFGQIGKDVNIGDNGLVPAPHPDLVDATLQYNGRDLSIFRFKEGTAIKPVTLSKEGISLDVTPIGFSKDFYSTIYQTKEGVCFSICLWLSRTEQLFEDHKENWEYLAKVFERALKDIKRANSSPPVISSITTPKDMGAFLARLNDDQDNSPVTSSWGAVRERLHTFTSLSPELRKLIDWQIAYSEFITSPNREANTDMMRIMASGEHSLFFKLAELLRENGAFSGPELDTCHRNAILELASPLQEAGQRYSNMTPRLIMNIVDPSSSQVSQVSQEINVDSDGTIIGADFLAIADGRISQLVNLELKLDKPVYVNGVPFNEDQFMKYPLLAGDLFSFSQSEPTPN